MAYNGFEEPVQIQILCKDLKGKGKGEGKSDVGPIHRPVDSNQGSVLVVPALEAEDSAASFQGPSDVSDHQRVQQPMRQAKLLRIPIVDSDMQQHLVFPKGNSSSISGSSGDSSSSSNSSSSSSSSSNSSSSSSSDGGSSSSPENDDSEDDDVYMSSGSTISAVGSHSSSSSHDSLEPQPQPNRVLDVDAMSSDGCPVHMLSEGEYSIHSPN